MAFKLYFMSTHEIPFLKSIIKVRATGFNLIHDIDVSIKTILDHFHVTGCQ